MNPSPPTPAELEQREGQLRVAAVLELEAAIAGEQALDRWRRRREQRLEQLQQPYSR